MRMEITNTFPDYLSELENKIVFFDNDLLVFDNLKDFNVKGKIEVEVYVLTLCTKGHGTLAVNEKKCELKSNDIFICRPSHILETLMMSVDFECLCICMTREFLQDILMRSNSSWNMKVYIEDNPVLHIDEEDAELIIQYAQLIKATMAQSNKHYYKEIVTSLLCAMSFNFSNILEKKISAEKPMFSTSENLFNDFFDLLTSTVARHRPVAYYAEKLNVTSKYLSVICKKVSGKTALEIITEYAIKEIETQLQRRDKTIKGIAVELGFENISYFSKYFKHFTGISPKKYRETNKRER